MSRKPYEKLVSIYVTDLHDEDFENVREIQAVAQVTPDSYTGWLEIDWLELPDHFTLSAYCQDESGTVGTVSDLLDQALDRIL